MSHKIVAILITHVLVECLLGAAGIPDASHPCPRECVCVNAPLKTAPFVLTWMTSWGEDDLPNLNPNEVLDASLMAASETASDADVNVDVTGLHATCSLHPTTNITRLLQGLPSHTMVLTILQAPGCNLTIVDGGQLVALRSLKALHLQGYAHVRQKQVSGFEPNGIREIKIHKKLMEREVKAHKEESTPELRLALAEDALQPLTSLELLDLQYVRLVASKEARRSRRYSKEPIASTTLLDMPLKQFLKLANKVDAFYLPPHLQHLDPDKVWHEFLDNDDTGGMENRIESLGESYKLQRGENELEVEITQSKYDEQSEEEEEGYPQEEMSDDLSNVVPYSIYKAEMEPVLAPFTKQNKLKYLRVAHARLDRIGVELLQGLQQLHTLTLEYNRIKIIPFGLFGPTPNLRHLSLAHNNVLLLDPDSLVGLNKLYTMDLDHNELSVLGLASFPVLGSLKTVRMSGNPITHLLPDAFANLNSTKNIFLGSFDVAMDVHENSFRFLNNLDGLVLNNVSMERLQKTLLSGMPSLQQLAIHGKVPEIDYDAFSPTPQLKELNLSHCHLAILSLDAFFGLHYLMKLDLSHNDLQTVSPGTFDHLTSLRELYLNNNYLTTLPLGIFLPIPARLIQLHNNPWYCTCDLLQLRPSITNKVQRLGHIVCQWDEKLATVCKKSKDRLLYDARVAPLCSQPSELAGNDVYHAALRHLKCSKYHWDPRLLLAEKKKENKEESLKLMKEREQKEKEEEKEKIAKEDKDENVGWLPLTAFTPEPIDTEDLLEIAEKEGLEEVIESSPETSTSPKPQTQQATNSSENNNVPQNDQPRKQSIIERTSLLKHLERKSKFKSLVKSKTYLSKLKTRLQHKGLHYKQKSKLKALIAAKQKGIKIYPIKKKDHSLSYDDNIIPLYNLNTNNGIY